MKISVVIITRSSAVHLAQTLECVKDFDELLLIDLQSTDNTLDIAKSFGCKIIEYKGEGNSIEDARNFALRHAKYPWVLMLEPNELCPEPLLDYMREFVAKGEADVLLVPRKNYLMYRFNKSSYPDYRPRLFRSRLVKWTPNSGSLPVIDGKIETLPASRQDMAIVHLSTGLMQKEGQKDSRRTISVSPDKEIKNVSLAGMFIGPLATFIKAYFHRGTLFHGVDGFVFAARKASNHFHALTEAHIVMRKQRFNNEYSNTGIQVPLDSENN